jgi:hypothetical protein
LPVKKYNYYADAFENKKEVTVEEPKPKIVEKKPI